MVTRRRAHYKNDDNATTHKNCFRVGAYVQCPRNERGNQQRGLSPAAGTHAKARLRAASDIRQQREVVGCRQPWRGEAHRTVRYSEASQMSRSIVDLKGNSGGFFFFFHRVLISMFSHGTDSPVSARVVQFVRKRINNFKQQNERSVQTETETGSCFAQRTR